MPNHINTLPNSCLHVACLYSACFDSYRTGISLQPILCLALCHGKEERSLWPLGKRDPTLTESLRWKYTSTIPIFAWLVMGELPCLSGGKAQIIIVMNPILSASTSRQRIGFPCLSSQQPCEVGSSERENHWTRVTQWISNWTCVFRFPVQHSNRCTPLAVKWFWGTDLSLWKQEEVWFQSR